MYAPCPVETPVSRIPPLGFFVHLLLGLKPLYEEIVWVSSFACFLSLTLDGLSFVFSFCSLFAVTPHSGGAVIPSPSLFKGWYFLQMGFLQCARLFRLCICCCDVYLYWCFSGLLVPVGSFLLPVTSASANSEYFCALVFLFDQYNHWSEVFLLSTLMNATDLCHDVVLYLSSLFLLFFCKHICKLDSFLSSDVSKMLINHQ